MPAKGDRKPAAERFEAMVDRTGECHLWRGGVHHRDGYGHFWGGRMSANGNPVMDRAHRWAYEHAYGPIPAGMLVLHSCDTPRCVRLDHLRLGTVADNSADMKARGRSLRGAKGPGAKLSEVQVAEIRALGGTMSQAAIASLYGVTQMSISNVLRGVTW